MSRSVKKGPYVDARLIGRVEEMNKRNERKVLKSATANAENNFNLSADELTVLSAVADDGPTLKRYRPRAQGRTFQILKRTSHITIAVADKEA